MNALNEILWDPLLTDLPTIRDAKILDRCVLIERIAQGAQGAVYRGIHLDLDLDVAIKVLHANFARIPEHVERFYREARAAARITDSNVVRVFDVRQAHGLHFLIAEFIHGFTLSELVHGEPLPEADVLAIAEQVARGLGALHAGGVVHRDVKPSNILVSNDGIVKLSDLGLAKADSDPNLTRVGDLLGTPSYMAPEQLRDPSGASPAADVFALGWTMFYMLTCAEPASIQTPVAAPRDIGGMVERHASAEIIRAHLARHEITAPVVELVLRCLAEGPEDRYENGLELAAAVESVGAACGAGALPELTAEDSASIQRPDTETLDAIRRELAVSLSAAPDSGVEPPSATESAPSLDPASQEGSTVPPGAAERGLRVPPGFDAPADARASGPEGNASIIAHPETGMRLRLIDAGTYFMGSTDGDEDERPIHEVRISRAFYLGEAPVTQSEWSALEPVNPSRFEALDRPVEQVSWHQAQVFCERLGGRLPSEAEWEFACRAGVDAAMLVEGTQLSPMDANFDGRYVGNGGELDYRRTTTSVRSFAPNLWGLFDMLGNVWEWCGDHYAADFYDRSALEDPRCELNDPSQPRVVRGGGWISTGFSCRATNRLELGPRTTTPYVGFRIVCEAL